MDLRCFGFRLSPVLHFDVPLDCSVVKRSRTGERDQKRYLVEVVRLYCSVDHPRSATVELEYPGDIVPAESVDYFGIVHRDRVEVFDRHIELVHRLRDHVHSRESEKVEFLKSLPLRVSLIHRDDLDDIPRPLRDLPLDYCCDARNRLRRDNESRRVDGEVLGVTF